MVYYFIINPHSCSGRSRQKWNQIEPELKRRGIAYHKYFTHFERHAIKIARTISTQQPGPKTIVIVGGDGTVNEVLNGVPDLTDITFGYIPSGSSNDFARSLGIPSNPLQALEHILSAERIRSIDYGILTINGRTRRYIGSAGIGYDASVCREMLESPVKSFLNRFGLGKLAYIIIALRQLLQNPLCRFQIRTDNGPLETYAHTFFLAPMNQPYEGGGLKMSPAAEMDDGLLTACIIYQMSRLTALLLLPTLFTGSQFRFPGTKQTHCKKLEVQTGQKLIVHTDGEYAGTSDHVIFEISSERLRVII